MKHINKTNNNISNNTTLSNIEDAKYLMLLCKERSDLVIKTEYGVGHYRFFKFNQIKGNFVMEFQLLDDNSFKDTDSILFRLVIPSLRYNFCIKSAAKINVINSRDK